MPDRPVKFLANGEPDRRGQSEGSKATRFATNDKRVRPGRRKGSPNEKTLVHALLNMKIGTGKDGKPRYLRQGILLIHAQKALKGDAKSTEYIQKLIDRYEVQEAEPDRTKSLLAEDAAILESLKARGLLPLTDVESSEGDLE